MSSHSYRYDSLKGVELETYPYERCFKCLAKQLKAYGYRDPRLKVLVQLNVYDGNDTIIQNYRLRVERAFEKLGLKASVRG